MSCFPLDTRYTRSNHTCMTDVDPKCLLCECGVETEENVAVRTLGLLNVPFLALERGVFWWYKCYCRKEVLFGSLASN